MADDNTKKRSLGVSWATASPEAKQGLPTPPERENFDCDESYEEAKSGWGHFIAPIMVRRQSLYGMPEEEVDSSVAVRDTTIPQP